LKAKGVRGETKGGRHRKKENGDLPAKEEEKL